MDDYIKLFSNAIDIIVSRLRPVIIETIKETIEQSLSTRFYTPPDEDLLTVNEAAKFLSCSRQTLWSYCKSGKIESYRIGQKVFFKKSDLTKGLKKRSFKSR